jgi:hypothetical protein
MSNRKICEKVVAKDAGFDRMRVHFREALWSVF